MSSVVISGNTSGSVTLSAPDVAGSTTYTFAANSGTISPLVSGTAVTASGTSVDFTGIPSWVKRITVMFSGVSTNGTSNILIQVGAGSIQTTGYESTSGNRVAETGSSAGLIVTHVRVAANLSSGVIVICLLSGNTYSSTGILTRGLTDTPNFSAGTVSSGDVIDRIRITTVNGTDTFDAGSINIMYE